MNPNKHKISIIIVNYKVKKELFECLESIYNSKQEINYEVIIVDNDDKNLIGKKLKQKFKKVKYIKSKKNLGFGAGNNLGANFAQGEYLFFLNPDTKILDGTLDNLYSFFIKNDKAGIISPVFLNSNLTPFKSQGSKELTPKNIIFSQSILRKILTNKNIYNENELPSWDMRSLIETNVVPGAAMMINADLFRKIGKFDETFFLYFEENDISKRISKLGYKLFIVPSAKIIHLVGRSTKHLNNIEDIYSKSRYRYLKKHYGILKAIFAQMILTVNKVFVLVLLALLLASFLRFVNLENSMTFIGDQGWFYLSARDLLIQGKIPLVGITSSHTWLHQGPLWTYMLSIALLISKFNPLSGGFLTAIFGVLTTYLMYKLGSSMFSVRVGVIASLLYATSPLIIFFDRMPFDPSPIPFFTVLYLYSLSKWIKGSINYFPFSILLIALLYNLELATFTLFFPFAMLFTYGFIKNKDWVRKLLNKKTICYSVAAVIVPMFPVIVYDFSNGFKQTIVFLGWTVYKPFSFFVKHSSQNFLSSIGAVVSFLLLNIQRIVFEYNLAIVLLLFFLSLIYLANFVYKNINLKDTVSKSILLFLLVTSILGILANQTPSDAYLPIIFPFVIFTVALFCDFLLKKALKYAVVILLIIITVLNSYASFKNSLTYDFKHKIEAVEKIVNLTNNHEYNLIGSGYGSQFRSFTMNYEYLLWWKGHPPTNKNVNLKIIVSETQEGIIITKR